MRLTPPCIVDQAVDVSVILHCDCDQPLQRDNHTCEHEAGHRNKLPTKELRQKIQQKSQMSSKSVVNAKLVSFKLVIILVSCTGLQLL